MLHITPPGFQYLFRLVFPQVISVIVVYQALIINGQRPSFSTYSTWLYFLVALFAYPAYLVVRSWYHDFRHARRAAELGAVRPPIVKESSSSILSAIITSFREGYIGDCFFEWHKQYGHIYRLRIYGEERMMTVEPEHIKAILATQFENFEKGPVVFHQFYSFLGLGVFNSDGDRWKFHRNLTRPFFSRNRISDFDNFDRHTEDTISIIKTRLAQGYPVDFQDAVARFTLDSATEFLFGKDVGSLGANLPYPAGSPLAQDPSILDHPSNVFVRAFMKGQTATAYRARFGWHWPLKEFWSDKVLPHRLKFVNPILEQRKAQRLAMTATEKADGEGETLLDHLIEYTEDPQVIKDELVNILVAGRDTTASLLTFCIYVLTERPDITEKLRREIVEKVGVSARPTYKVISEMKYLRAFVNETLRLYPGVPFDGRSTKNSIVLPGINGQLGYYIPAGVRCQYSVFLMHRREDLWGPDALEFDPERFIDERLHKYLTPNPFIFLPFNAGPRICLGQLFAYNETSYFLIKFLQAFTDFQIAWDVQPESSKPPVSWIPMAGTTKGRDKVLKSSSLTMSVKEALWVRMKDISLVEAT
ncbi:cytochrome P450 monooxygenase pc-3 [Rhodocollybia butyracea]|uniref:Cytochrome P450 monooxygenase pc-3 n=1 Tax=Rhodocollybia butyracea TaxID=206335 RepID=A0A9P5Q4L0_9AGAR|nr:cytochrome P450 monooxygenase pc-3 [Rhodocollybia butyracea]